MTRGFLGALAIVVTFALAGCDSSNSTKTDLSTADVAVNTDTLGGTDTTTGDTGRDIPSTTDTAGTDTAGTDLVVTDTATTDTNGTDTNPPDVTGDTTVPADCTGACDTDVDTYGCMADGLTMCACGDSGWAPVTCADVCAANGMVGDQCIAGEDGSPTCGCTFDCQNADLVATQCTNAKYTPCTCGAADPCQWVGDNVCDEACATTFPDDHFTDPDDCSCDNTTAVTAACENTAYTACTCAVANPCSWIGDEYCDSTECNTLFPNQANFDDSATDCTAP